MIYALTKKTLLKKLRRFIPSSVVCLCCRKVNTNNERNKIYEKTSIMHGIGGKRDDVSNGIDNRKTLVAL